MRRYVRAATSAAAFAVGLSSAHAQSDSYHITGAERAACFSDAVRLCAAAYPDEGKMLFCMNANKAALSSQCRVVFDAGLKRRHIVIR